MRINVNKKVILTSLLLACCMLIPIIYSFTSSAELVDVYEVSSDTEHLELDWTNVYNTKSEGWKPSGDLVQGGGSYDITASSWSMWYDYDACTYAYTTVPFNTGEDSVLTVKMNIEDWSGRELGIMVRESLDADSPGWLGSVRDDWATLVWREEKTINCAHQEMRNMSLDYGKKEYQLKLVITKLKKGTTAAVYYQENGDIDAEDGWILIKKATKTCLKDALNLYVGIYSASASETNKCHAIVSDFQAKLQAPEGYEIEDGGSSGDDTEKEPDIKLPEDLASAGDTMLYETFTDGNIYPAESQINITNPLWCVRSGEPNVFADEATSDRYLLCNSLDDVLLMTAGDMSWTDYSVQLKFAFTENTLDSATNELGLMFRHRAALIGGAGEYILRLENDIVTNGIGFNGQYLRLYYRGPSEQWISSDSRYEICAEYCISKEGMLSSGVEHTIKVDVFDVTYSVYLDDMKTPVLIYEDTNTGKYYDKTTEQELEDPHTRGCIGLYIQEADIIVDDILVRKLDDALGGDYDNDIMGDYDQPIPAWIKDSYGYGEVEDE